MRFQLVDGMDPGPVFHRRIWTVAVWCLAFAVPAWMWTSPARAEEDTGPAALVRAYLEAVRDGDVALALDLAGRHPQGDQATFLTSRALDRDWVVNSVSVPGTPYLSAKAEVVITGADGAAVSGWFDLRRDDVESRWEFEDPLIEVRFAPSPLWYVEINGVVAPYVRDPDPPVGSDAGPSFFLLPGVYRFYDDVPGLLDLPEVRAPLLPRKQYGPAAVERIRLGPPSIGPEGIERVQAALNAYLDDCARMAGKSLAGCPFGVDLVLDPENDEYYFPHYRDVGWEIGEYPVVAVVPDSASLTLAHRRTGTAAFTATGVDGDERVAVSMSCPIRADGLEAGVLADGGLRIVPAGSRFVEKWESSPRRWTTC